MFTGIIEELGTVRTVHRQKPGIRLLIQTLRVGQDCQIGDSVCVNGVCLTVVKTGGSIIEFDVMAETMKCSNLGFLKAGDKVNLERALKIGQRLNGHFVSGHVDDVGIVRYCRTELTDLVLGIEINQRLLKLVSLKGSIAVDGVSLTVSGLDRTKQIFQVNIIPHTAQVTTLGLVRPEDKVNVEVDILARYIYHLFLSEKVLGSKPDRKDLGHSMGQDKQELSEEFLTKHGFV